MFEAISEQKKVKLIIRYDRACNGYYLYAYNLNDNKCIADHLCDDLSQAFYVAKEDCDISEEDYDISEDEFKNIN
jgi:hypothetical protein